MKKSRNISKEDLYLNVRLRLFLKWYNKNKSIFYEGEPAHRIVDEYYRQKKSRKEKQWEAKV